MCALTGGILRQTAIRTVGLCHSVQVCATTLLRNLDMLDGVKDLQWKRRTVGASSPRKKEGKKNCSDAAEGAGVGRRTKLPQGPGLKYIDPLPSSV